MTKLIEEIKKDIIKIEQIDKKIHALINEKNTLIHKAEAPPDGSLWELRIKSKWKDREESYKKGREIRNKISKPYEILIKVLRQERYSIEDKYKKHFKGVSYDSPYDGWSDFTEFLTVVVSFLEDVK